MQLTVLSQHLMARCLTWTPLSHHYLVGAAGCLRQTGPTVLCPLYSGCLCLTVLVFLVLLTSISYEHGS